MAKQKSENKIPELNVGIVGHIDHGKTTLLSKLTGKFTDTHSEELKRGITIKLGYADMMIYKCGEKFSNKNEKGCRPYRYVSFIDAPGHEMLMATMLSGAATMDLAILVIAANEGIKPQTREHLMALQAKKINKVIIVQNKIDLVSREKALENYKEIKNFVKGTIAENAKVIPVSTLQEINIDKLTEEIANAEIPKRETNKDPIFLVARSFDINKPGAEIKNLHGGVLGGILKQGILKERDEIEIKPGITVKKGNQNHYETINAKIVSLYRGKEKVRHIFPGVSVSIETSLDPYVTKTDSLNGCVVSVKGKLPEITNNIKLKTKIFDEMFILNEKKKIEEIKTKEMLMISVNTTTSVGVVEKVSPNFDGTIELSLNIPVVALQGNNVGIARNVEGHWRLIGWGEILE